jgi:hypothetical protein
VRGWLRRGLAAAQLAGDRSDLWPAGSLAWLAYLGWLPLLVVLARPDPNGLAFLGVSIYTSSAFPWNVVALAAASAAIFVLLCVIAAAAEVALLRSAGGDDPHPTPYGRAVMTAFTVILVSTLPAVGAGVLVLLGVMAIAPAEFQSPEIGTPVLLRLAGPLLPYLVVMVLALLVGQLFGGLALRAAQAAPQKPVTAAFVTAARALVRRPWASLGVAGGGLLLDALNLVFTFALLRVLWAPIAAALSDGRVANPSTLLLLLGFVAIWLALLLVAGALHVVVSAWWAMELAQGRRGEAH